MTLRARLERRAGLRAGRCRARRSAWAGAPTGRRAVAAAVCAPRSPRSSFSSRKHQRGKIAGTPTLPAYCAAAMDAGVAPPYAGEPAQVFGGHGHLVGERDQHAIGRGRRVRDPFADRAGDAFGPVAIHGDGGRAVPQQRCEFGGVGAEHDGDGMAGEFHRAADDGVHERASVDAHQLFGRAETRGGARGQHHDVDVARLGCGLHGVGQRRERNPMASTDTTQTPAIIAGLARHLGERRTRNDFEHHEDRDGRQRQDGEAGEHPGRCHSGCGFRSRSSAVRGSWPAILLRLPAGCPSRWPQPLNRSHLAACFCVGPCASARPTYRFDVNLRPSVQRVRDCEHAVFRTPGNPAQVHPLAGGRLHCRHRCWSSLVINLVVIVGLGGHPRRRSAR